MVSGAAPRPAQAQAPVALRSLRERVVQMLWFEGVALLVVSPLFAWATGVSAAESLAVIAALSAAMMLWSALFNTFFDHLEARLAGRRASDRPWWLRGVHAVGLEVSAVAVSLPLLLAMTSLGWWEALLAELALTGVYAVYGLVFHGVFDRLRPVVPPAGS